VASDPDGGAVSYGAADLPPGLSVDAASGLITGTTTTPNVYTVTAIATDTGDLSHSRTFIWTVVPKPVGRVKFIQANSSAEPTSASPSSSVSVRLAAAQAAGHLNVVVVAWRDATARIQSVTDTAGNMYQLAVGPTVDAAVGTQAIYYAANIAAAPAGGNAVTVTFTAPPTQPDIRVAAYAGIDPLHPIDVAAAAQGTGVTLDSGAMLTTFADDLLVGASFVAAPATTAPGPGYTSQVLSRSGNLLEDRIVSAIESYRATATASAAGRWIMQMVAFRDPNPVPTLTSPGPQTSAENTSAWLSLRGSDPDGEPLTYTVTTLPPSALTVNPTTGLITGVFSFTSAGTYTVTATVSDGEQTVSQTFTWTVTNVNRAPVLTAVADQTHAENAPVTLSLVASDPDGTALSFSATGLPPGLSVHPTTGVITGTLSYTSVGTYPVTATVSDGEASTSTSFTWTVVKLADQMVLLNYNGDAFKDVLQFSERTGAWMVKLGNAQGQLVDGPAGTWAVGWQVHVADFNGDARDDLFLYSPSTGVWFKAMNTGTGFAYFTQSWAAGFSVFIVDLNGDRKSDVFIYNPLSGAWFTCISTGTGAAGFEYRAGTWAPGWQILPADFNGDGRSDLFLHNALTGTYFKAIATGTGDFTYTTGVWATGWTPVIVDLNADGHADVFVYNTSSGVWYRGLSMGDGTGGFSFVAGQWAPGWRVSAADVNGDHRSDLFLYNPASGVWYEAVNSGTDFTYFSGVWKLWTTTVSDLNGDGRSDLFLHDPASGVWYQAMTTSPGAFSYTTGQFR
jgi:PKD repeat protein